MPRPLNAIYASDVTIRVATTQTCQQKHFLPLVQLSTHYKGPAVRMSSNSTPSSRRRGHSSRKSQSSIPAQSQASGTPRAGASRLQENGIAVASSSPMFFSSSPANGSQTRRNRPGGSSRGQNDLVISSPPRHSSNAGDQENTPRATRQAAGGKLRFLKYYITLTADRILTSSI